MNLRALLIVATLGVALPTTARPTAAQR